jgi:long-chain fatty acid transport protein
MKRVAVGLGLALAAAVGRPTLAVGQGFTIYETGACSLGRAGAGVASPCGDGSAIAVNPAGLLETPRVLSVGANTILTNGTFTNNTTGLSSELETGAIPVPAAFFNRPIGDRFAVGLGLFAPFGLTTEWDANTAQGRFYASRTQLSAVYLQPTVAAQFGPVMLGVGLNISYLDVRLERRIDLASTPVPGQPITFGQLGIPYGTDFASSTVEGTDWGVGYNLGALVKVHDRIRAGARYLSRQKFTKDDATARFAQVPTGLVLTAGNPIGVPGGTPVDALLTSQFGADGPLSTQNVSTAIRLPEIIAFGVSVKPVEQLNVMVDAQYTNWEVFTEVPLVFEKLGDQTLIENYVSTWSYRVGGEYAFGDAHDVRLRAGWLYNEAATPDETVTPALPENERNVFTLGMGARFGPVLTADVGYMYVRQADRIGRSRDVNDGIYHDFDAHLIGVSFSFSY